MEEDRQVAAGWILDGFGNRNDVLSAIDRNVSNRDEYDTSLMGFKN